jgi:hypothetical protein
VVRRGHLAQAGSKGEHHRVILRKPRPESTLDDVVEVLQGLGQMLMSIGETLEGIAAILRDEDDGEADT